MRREGGEELRRGALPDRGAKPGRANTGKIITYLK